MSTAGAHMAETLANHTSGGGFSSTACCPGFWVRVWSGEPLVGGVVVETSCWVLKEQPGPRLAGFCCRRGASLWRGCCFWPVPSSTKLCCVWLCPVGCGC